MSNGAHVEVIENIPVRLDADEVVKRLRIRRNVEYFRDKLASLIKTLFKIVFGKFIYSISRSIRLAIAAEISSLIELPVGIWGGVSLPIIFSYFDVALIKACNVFPITSL